MTEPTHTPGRFVWYELMSSDTERSAAFYSELFGWTVSEMEMPKGIYRVLTEGEDGIAGLYGIPEGEEIPDHWIGYISGEPDSVAARTRAFEGQVLVPPQTVPEVGKMTVLMDPQGASIAAFKGDSGDPPPKDPIPTHRFCWSHLSSTDVIGSQSYYQMAFRMKGGMPGESGMVMLSAQDGGEVASISAAPEGTRSSWLHYVVVADLGAASAKAKSLGATVLRDGEEYPGIGHATVIADPTGAVIALFQPLKS
jgi:predicted enzyme related to lactoylglutathione lyase